MQTNKSQYERLLALDEQLRTRRYPNRAGFTRDWEVSTKTVQRDLAFLRDRLMAPLEFESGRNGYYYTDPSWCMPALTVTEAGACRVEAAVASARYYPYCESETGNIGCRDDSGALTYF